MNTARWGFSQRKGNPVCEVQWAGCDHSQSSSLLGRCLCSAAKEDTKDPHVAITKVTDLITPTFEMRAEDLLCTLSQATARQLVYIPKFFLRAMAADCRKLRPPQGSFKALVNKDQAPNERATRLDAELRGSNEPSMRNDGVNYLRWSKEPHH